MTRRIGVYVNERPVQVAPGSTVVQVVEQVDAVWGNAVRSGLAYVTDGVGRHISPSTNVVPGSILRVVHSARRAKPDRDLA